MRARRLTDLGTIQAFLDTDRLWAAYALGDLEPELRKLSEWYGAEDEGGLIALALLFKGFDPPALFTIGDAQGIDSILRTVLRAPRVYLNVREEHLPAIREHYQIESLEPMWRMTLEPEEFRPTRGRATYLPPERIPALEQLYALGGGDAFRPSQVRDGAFFGIDECGRLLAAAGTHVVSDAHSVTAVGNVFTHPDHRCKGHASLVTSAVCAEMIRRGIRTIVLNVAQANVAAIHVYEKLGFRKYAPFVEGRAARKSML